MPPRRDPPACALLIALLVGGCASVELSDLSTPRPAPRGSCVVIGFMGGLDAWDDPAKGARRMALALREPADRRYAETFENRRLDVASDFVLRALDRDRDGVLTGGERLGVRWVIYGQSLGGGAANTLAWRLSAMGIPVELLLLLDSVGPWDEPVAANVRSVAALYQDEGWVIRGERSPRVVDPARTRVLVREFDYDRPPGSEISLAGLPWWKLALRVAHSRMDRDPRVWARARSLTRSACAGVAASGGIRAAGPSPPGDDFQPDGFAVTSSGNRSRSRSPAPPRMPRGAIRATPRPSDPEEPPAP